MLRNREKSIAIEENPPSPEEYNRRLAHVQALEAEANAASSALWAAQMHPDTSASMAGSRVGADGAFISAGLLATDSRLKNLATAATAATKEADAARTSLAEWQTANAGRIWRKDESSPSERGLEEIIAHRRAQLLEDLKALGFVPK